MKAKMTAAVTGAGGFIGKRVCWDLAAAGWKVYALTSRPSAFPLQHSNIIPVEWDWRQANTWPKVLRSVSLCVHAAACVDFKDEKIYDLYHGNFHLTASLAEFLAQKTHARLVYLSTVSVYGSRQSAKAKVIPCPDKHYGISKLLGEKACLEIMGKRCTVLRLAGVWGNEKQPKLFINRLILDASKRKNLAVQGRGTGSRNYLWVGEISKIVQRAFAKKWTGLRIASSREKLTIADMAQMIAKYNNVQIRFLKSNLKERNSLAEFSSDLPPQQCFSDALKIEAIL